MVNKLTNKGWVIIGVFLWEYFFVMLCGSLNIATTGGTLLQIPTDPSFLDIVVTYFKIFKNLLFFSVVGIPNIVIFIAVYIPLLVFITALVSFVRKD